MSSARSDDVWGPKCRLAKLFGDLWKQTAQSAQPVGIGRLYNQVTRWATDNTKRADIRQLPKNRIQQMLAGKGRPPNWEETVTLARVLQFFAAEAGSTQSLNEDTLRKIVEVTHTEVPRELDIAEHFARKVLEWGQQHVVECATKSLEDPSRVYGSPELRHRRQIKAIREDLIAPIAEPSHIIEGSVAIAHTNPVVPLYYRDVFDRSKLERVKDILEWSGLIRPGGHNINVNVQHLESGVRLLVAIYLNQYSLKAFVVIEALSSGSVAVYFRWIPRVSEDEKRLDLLMNWGVSGATRLCLHIHEILDADGTLNAFFVLPTAKFGTYQVPRLPLPESDRWDIGAMMCTYFTDLINVIPKADQSTSEVREF